MSPSAASRSRAFKLVDGALVSRRMASSIFPQASLLFLGVAGSPGGVSAAAAATSADSRSESAATFAAAPKPRAIAPTHIVIGRPTTTNRTQTQTGVFFFSVVTTSGRQDAPPETSTGRQAKHGRRGREGTSGFALVDGTIPGTCEESTRGKFLGVVAVPLVAVHMRHMVERKRERHINIRVTDEEADMLKTLAERTGLTQSDVLRQSIRRAYAELDPKPKTKGKR